MDRHQSNTSTLPGTAARALSAIAESEPAKKHPGGRPSKYKPAFCDQIVACGEAGDSRTQMAVKLGIARETLNNWGKAQPEFLAALKRADTFSQSWWEDRLRDIAVTGKGNVTAIIFALKNRFKEDWQERHNVAVTGSVEVNHKDARERLARIIDGEVAARSVDEGPRRIN